MKSFIVLSGLFLALSANAAEVKVMTVDQTFGGFAMISSRFEINKDMGRAWVETTVDSRTNADSDIGYDSYRNHVDGLSFDQNTSEVVLDIEGARVVCATVRVAGRGIFRHNKIKPTGNCKFVSRQVKVVEDNGFETYNRTKTAIFIVTK